MSWKYFTRTTLFIFWGLAIPGCGSTATPSPHGWPKYPLCFIEMGEAEYAKHLKPLKLDEVLLVPYYKRNNDRVVAHPFLYKPQQILRIPDYNQGYGLLGVIAVCPGYFGKGVRFEFCSTEKIKGQDCQLEPLLKARDAKEAKRILLDFKYLLSQKTITLGTTRNPLTIKENEKYVYATSTDFSSPNANEYCDFSLWRCEHGTKLRIDLTTQEINLVNEFITEGMKPDRHSS